MPLVSGARFAAGDGHRVEVAEQVEGDLAPVGRDVEVHPGALRVSMGDLMAGAGRALTSHLLSTLAVGSGAAGMLAGLCLGQRLGRAGLRDGRRDRRGGGLSGSDAGERSRGEKDCERRMMTPPEDIWRELWRPHERKATSRQPSFVEGRRSLTGMESRG